MAAWLWVAVLALITLAGGIGTGWDLLQHLAYALLGLELLGLALACLARRGLSVSRSVDRVRVTAGEEVEETYQVEKRGRFPAWRIDIGERSLSLGGGTSQTVVLTHRFPRRGCYQLLSHETRVRDPFGLFSLDRTPADDLTVTVYPRPTPTAEAQRLADSSHSHHQQRYQPADATMGDLRSYRPGDPPARVHWRSSARTGQLMVADPEGRRRSATWLLVNLGGDQRSAEAAAGIAAYLMGRLWQAGEEVGAVIAGEELALIPPRRTRGQMGRILEPLALVRTARHTQLERLFRAASRCRGAGSLVVISDGVDRDQASRRLRSVCPTVSVIPCESAAGRIPT